MEHKHGQSKHAQSSHGNASHGNASHSESNHYLHLGVMVLLSFAAMYFLMYAMVASVSSVYMSVNQVYMAALMTAPMVVIELLVMRSMYSNAELNRLLIAGSVIVGVAMFFAIRQQVAVGDSQFLRSMIPHHSGAILMCREAVLSDPELKVLCQAIISGQQREIEQMTAKLQQR
jgi:uncharacterized protein (DUF305 family)